MDPLLGLQYKFGNSERENVAPCTSINKYIFVEIGIIHFKMDHISCVRLKISTTLLMVSVLWIVFPANQLILL